MKSQQQLALSCNDEFIASIVVSTTENPQIQETLMSDGNFAQELQLQEVIISSLNNLPSSGRRNQPAKSSSKRAAKGGGKSSQSLCEICAEKKDGASFFPMRNCDHAFCRDCISRHISIKVKKRTIVGGAAAETIACPGDGCGGAMEVAACRKVVPREVVGAWDELLCEAALAAEEKVYCPYKNCSAMLVKDGGAVREAECPLCRRLFCASCRVPWHAGIDCEGFSRLGKDEREDKMVRDLAKQKKWKRCSSCCFFVERNAGCLHMTCRCGYQFCYACGKAWSSTHGGCQ